MTVAHFLNMRRILEFVANFLPMCVALKVSVLRKKRKYCLRKIGPNDEHDPIVVLHHVVRVE